MAVSVSDLNRYNISLDNYKIQLSPGSTFDIVPGTGFNMNDPLFPIPRGKVFIDSQVDVFSFLDPATVPENVDVPLPNALAFSNSYVKRETDYLNEARTLAINFSGSYSIVSASIAYQRARQEIQNKAIFYFIIEVKGNSGLNINDAAIGWNTEPTPNLIADPNERLRQFINQYGSHFVRRIYYGQKIIIRAAYNDLTSSAVESFSAAVNATSLFWNASLGISQTHRQILSSSKTEISIALTCGEIQPEQAIYGPTTFDEVFDFLSNIKQGTITIKSGPVECDLDSFWYTLDPVNHRNCREILARQQSYGIEANSPFGVPKGTVIAWTPRQENIELDPISGAIIRIIPPDGWALCDGSSPDIPNLLNRFIIGTNSFQHINNYFGPVPETSTHTHKLNIDLSQTSRKGSDWKWGETPWKNGPNPAFASNYSFETLPETIYPPSIALAYIIKL